MTTNKTEFVFTVLKLPIDYLMLVLAGLMAYGLRFEEKVTEIRPVVFDLNFSDYVLAVLIISAVWLTFFAIAKLYTFRHYKITDEIGRVILACSTGMSAVIIYMFFVRELFSSRFIVLFAWILSIFFVVIGRSILRRIKQHLHMRGIGSHRVALIGKNKETSEIISTLKLQPELGQKMVGHIKGVSDNNLKELEQLHKKFNIDQIIQTDSTISRIDTIKLMDFAEANNIVFKYAAGTFETRTSNIDVSMLGGVPIIEINKTKLEGWGKVWKRIIDILFSATLIILFSPLLLIIAIAVRLNSKGPAIFKNKRVSKKGEFHVYKFRSMYSEFSIGDQFGNSKKALEYEKELIKKQSKREGPLYKVLKDPRRTSVGHFIEKTSLDELPQLFNVLVGNMSLVGPRPHQPREVAKYKGYQKRVLDIKPGISGLAQISGRSDLDFDEEVKLDTYYMENWSLKLDFWVMLKTPFVVLTRKKS